MNMTESSHELLDSQRAAYGLEAGGSPSLLLEQLCLFEFSLPGMFRSVGPVLSWVCDAHSNSTLCTLRSICSSYLHFRLGEYLAFFFFFLMAKRILHSEASTGC